MVRNMRTFAEVRCVTLRQYQFKLQQT